MVISGVRVASRLAPETCWLTWRWLWSNMGRRPRHFQPVRRNTALRRTGSQASPRAINRRFTRPHRRAGILRCNRHRSRRTPLAPLVLLAAALTLALASACARRRRTSRLPDIGSSAGELLDPAQQARVRRDDAGAAAPLRLHARRSADRRLARQRSARAWPPTATSRASPSPSSCCATAQINAFATLGGYIGMNAGLVLTAEREDEVAGVLSHEIAHVTQRPRAARRRARAARQRADPAGDARRDRRGAGGRRQFRRRRRAGRDGRRRRA